MPTQPEMLDAIGIESIAARIEAGETQSEMAQSIGVNVSILNQWMHGDPKRSARARAAMTVSAEAMQDRGLAALRDAPPDNAEIARARALEQHWARRAAIRNPRHSPKLAIGQAEDMPPLMSKSDEELLAEIRALQAKLSGG